MVFFASITNILACTRAVYIGENNLVITGRTMDWKSDQETNIWAFPRGIKRDGKAGENSISWISKYGSIATSAYDIATVDGMNEKGLTTDIEVDGGIYHKNVAEVLAAGANVMVSGSGVFKGDIKDNTAKFMEILNGNV